MPVPIVLLWALAHRRDVQVWRRRTPHMETRNNPEPTVPHTPEQGQRSTRMTRARAPLAGESGHRASPARLPTMGTEPAQLPPGRPSLSPGPGLLQSTWRDVTDGLQCRDAAPGEQPGTRERIRVHLILFSVFADSCFGENKQSWVCEVIGIDKNSVDNI